MTKPEDQIIWPERFHPSNAPIAVRNEIHIDASPGAVWAVLIDAIAWPEWYSNSANVEIVDKDNKQLMPGIKFKWKTFGINLVSQITEYVPNERIAWTAEGLGVSAYHAWLIKKTPAGCDVLTEETQHGWLCRLSATVFPDRMYRYHQIWLEQLKKRVTSK